MPESTPDGHHGSRGAYMRPALLVDVDGVLNPMSDCQPPDCECHPGWTVRRQVDRFTLHLNPSHGPALLDLAESTGAELIWASYWMKLANEHVGPYIGLPPLPWVSIPRQPSWGRDSVMSIGNWKAWHVAEWAKERDFVWLEDEPDANDALTYRANVSDVGLRLLIQVDSRTGLTDDHLDQARIALTQYAKIRKGGERE